MHMVIRALVAAKDEQEALEKAREIFEDLVEQEVFDYFVTFDEDTPVAGRRRWGNLPVVAEYDSKEGKALVEEGMKYTWDEFKEHITEVRKILNEFTDRELFEETPKLEKAVKDKLMGNRETFTKLLMFSYHLKESARYPGPSVFLYMEHGEPITNRTSLKRAIEWLRQRGKIYVVPADVHY